MNRKRKASFSNRGVLSSKATLPENSCGDDMAYPSKRKKPKKQQDKKLTVAASAGFYTTQLSYDFKHLDAPYTITSKSSLAPVSDEDTQLVSGVDDGDSGQVPNMSLALSSVEPKEFAPRSSVETPSATDVVPSPHDQKIDVAVPSSSTSPPENHRELRRNTRAFTAGKCPVCGITVRKQDIQHHYKSELEKLDALRRTLRAPDDEAAPVNMKLERVQANRRKRSRTIGEKSMKDAAVITCLACNPELVDVEMTVQSRALLHLTECIGIRGEILEDAVQEITSHEDDRIVLLSDHVDSLSYNRIINVDDESFPVNVEFDDDIMYGPPQFNEQNLIPCASDMSDGEQSALREAVISCCDDDVLPPLEVSSTNEGNGIIAVVETETAIVVTAEAEIAQSTTGIAAETATQAATIATNAATAAEAATAVAAATEATAAVAAATVTKATAAAAYAAPSICGVSIMDGAYKPKTEENNQQMSSALVFALANRIKELEEQLQIRSMNRCNICLEHYKDPLVSVICWHVSCQACWMKTLGVKKLCPQCSKITLPTSLRRVYL